MKQIISLLRLIRWLNLFFIALTQYLVQYTIIKPILAQAQIATTLNDFTFLLLVLSTVLIAAGGYVINDYFDVKIDEVNKPKRIFIDRVIPRRAAMLLHQFLSGSGIIIAIYVAWQAGSLKLALIHPLVAAFLWFYSTGYKRRLLAGNIIVAFLSGFVVLIVAIYEQHLFSLTDSSAVAPAYSIFIITFFYFVFSFLVSFARELVKDMEDIEGDRKYNCKTVPIVFGIEKTKWLTYFLLGLVLTMLIYFQWMQVNGNDFVSALTIFTTLEFPVLITFYLLKKASGPLQFSAVSSVLKIIMFMGIMSMVYFYFIMK